jgi:peptidoglycan/xylan/chitin deacetylase (PgdA/CDA1 family)
LAEVLEKEAQAIPEAGVDETSMVSILGYHDFTLTRAPTEMLIREDKFRSQMQMLKDADIPVISLDNFLAWRRKELDLPKRCVVITADDGWREVRTYMLPILKEFGYPFTVFLYTNFLDSGGRTLTQAQVEEIIASGGMIGSHSVSHRDMNRVKVGNEVVSFGRFERLRTAYSKGLEELDGGASSVEIEGVKRSRATVEAKLKELAVALAEYDEWITDELKTSKEALEAKFKVPVTTFAYPYGPYNDRIIKTAMDLGYQAMITVNGAKANFETPLGEIPRFIIHGADDRNWNMATSFGGAGGLDTEGDLLSPKVDENGVREETLVVVSPAEGELVADRQPVISFDFSKLDGVEPSSLEMHVGGFGKVPATLDQEGKVLSWKVTRKLRNEHCIVRVDLKQAGKSRRVTWQFSIDKLVLYTPAYEERFPREELEGTVPKAIPVGRGR